MSITPESVRELLQSEDLGDRLRAVNQFRQLSPGAAFEIAQMAVTDSSARVRYAAVSQMATLGREDSQAALSILRDRLHNDTEADVQAAAADSLSALHLTEAFEDLQQMYQNSPEWIVKFSIVAALGEMGDERSFDLLEDALTNGQELVKTAAISSLGELGDRRAIPLLIPYAADADWQVRHRVAQALGRLGSEQARSILESLAKDEMEPVAQAAKVSLGTAG